MLSIALNIGFVGFSLAIIITILRLFIGPSLADRILALDTLYMNALGLMVLTGIAWTAADGDRSYHYEVALLVALMGFVGTVAGARYVARGDAVE